MTSRYARGLRELAARPGGLLGRGGGARSTGRSRGTSVFDPDAGVYGRWFAGAECNTCYNCLDRHVDEAAGEQTALIYDSPVTGTAASVSPMRELLDEVAALAAVLRDLGVGKGDRVIIYMPMIPEAAIAMLACARLGAIHSVVFGGFAAHELATRIDDAKPKLIISASCGIEPGRVVAYKPLLDARDRAGQAQARRAASSCSAMRSAARLIAGPRPRLGRGDGDGARGRTIDACRSRRPTRSTSSTPPARPASRRASCATMAATWSRSNGRCRTIYGIDPGEVVSGRRPTSAGWSAIPTSSTRRCCTAAPRVLYEGKPVGTPDAGAFWRVISRAQASPRCSPRRPPSAPSRREDPDGRAHRQVRSVEVPHAVPRRRARRPRHDPMGGAASRRAGHRSLVADRDRLVDLRQPGRARHAAGQVRLARRADAGLRPARPRRRRPAGRRRRRSATSS